MLIKDNFTSTFCSQKVPKTVKVIRL